MRFYCFVGFSSFFFLLGTVNSSQVLWICFPKLSPDAYCVVHVFQTFPLPFPPYVWAHSRENKPTPCPLQSQGVNPNQCNVQRLKSGVIYSIQLMEMILSSSCACLRSGRNFLPEEPPRGKDGICPVPKSPIPALSLSWTQMQLLGQTEQLPVTPWVPGWGFFGSSFPHRPYMWGFTRVRQN